MYSRRWGIPALAFVLAVITAGMLLCVPSPALAARDTVKFDGYLVGTIVIKTSQRRLYYVLPNGTAYRYPVGVGRTGKSWTGSVFINDWAKVYDSTEEGGFKLSGLGRLNGEAALDDFVEYKHIALNPGLAQR